MPLLDDALCDQAVAASTKEALAARGGPDRSIAKIMALSRAVDVLMAKHDRKPKCVEDCNQKLGAAAERK